MVLIELYTPEGSLNQEQRRQLAERMVHEMTTGEDAPEAVLEAARAFFQVVVHEPETWVVDGRAVSPAEPPRYIVRVTVPAAWRKEMSEHVIALITRLIAEADANPQRLYEEPHVWVQIVGILEGSYGLFGKVMRSTDIVEEMVKPMAEAGADALLRDPPPGMAIDPVCGMTVPIGETASTWVYEGTTYAFCSTGCRTVFKQRQRAAAGQS